MIGSPQNSEELSSPGASCLLTVFRSFISNIDSEFLLRLPTQSEAVSHWPRNTYDVKKNAASSRMSSCRSHHHLAVSKLAPAHL